MYRKPIVEGLSYAHGKVELVKQIEGCFTHKEGPGDLPVAHQRGMVHAVILPHGPYSHSGPCAAWVFKELAESEPPECYLILSVAHREQSTCTTDANFLTPLGVVENDDALRGLLISLGIPKNPDAHNREHAIEVQLPFLQYLFKNPVQQRFVPLLIGDDDPQRIASIIRQAIERYGKRVCLLISTDFTHYGNRYRYTPFVYNVRDELYKMDARAINYICSQDTEGFLKFCEETKSTICGKQAIAVLLEYLEMLQQPFKYELLKYYTSADITGGYERGTIGYASLVVR